MQVRIATIDDITQIKKLEEKWIEEGISRFMKKDDLKTLKKAIKKNQLFIAENKDRIVGYAKIIVQKSKKTLKIYNLRKGQRYVDIDSIFILKSYRRKGVGKKLLGIIDDFARFNKIKLIILSADNINVKGIINFYKKQGFKTHFVRMFKQLED